MMCPLGYVNAGHDRYIVHLHWPMLLASTPRVVRLVMRGCPVRPLVETLCGSVPVLEDVTYGWDTEYHSVDPATSGLQYVVETITRCLIRRAELFGHPLMHVHTALREYKDLAATGMRCYSAHYLGASIPITLIDI